MVTVEKQRRSAAFQLREDWAIWQSRWHCKLTSKLGEGCDSHRV